MITAPLDVANSGVRLAADTRGEGPNLVCTTGWANDSKLAEIGSYPTPSGALKVGTTICSKRSPAGVAPEGSKNFAIL